MLVHTKNNAFTAKEQMDCRKELEKKNEQKKVDTWEKTGKKYGKNEQNWQTTKLYIILQQNCILF